MILDPGIRFSYFVRPSLDKLSRQYWHFGESRIHAIDKRKARHSLRPLAPLAQVVFFAALPAFLWTRMAKVAPMVISAYLTVVQADTLDTEETQRTQL